MIIKSHIRGGFRAAAQYLSDVGKNEKTRLVEISDLDAADLFQAFRNMWIIASHSKVQKPLHHISINPFKDERLTDDQVRRIVERAEQKYGYKPGDHQRVIVEHVLDGRQHFHVMWNRVSLSTNRAVWPGHHWKKSKQVAREMEEELGFKRPAPRRVLQQRTSTSGGGRKIVGFHSKIRSFKLKLPVRLIKISATKPTQQPPVSSFQPVAPSKGWPAEAVLDWETWGKLDPVRFFRLWKELAPPDFSPT